METTQQPQHGQRQKLEKTPVVSATLRDGTLLETVYRPDEGRTLLCVSREGEVRYEPSLDGEGERLVPYSPRNNLLTNGIVLLPSEATEYGTDADLVAAVREYIHRYVDVSPLYEEIASYYVLFSWVFDAFSELPYLRLRGDAGSGKTRFLTIVGSLCYKPIFASGASTVSPLFRILDAVKGTLIIDEGDFRASDEKAEIVKILNNGNAEGFPVLRTEVSSNREFMPTAYMVYGPKLVATRGFFEDRALETRCLTEDMGHRPLRDDIPVGRPKSYKAEALQLRNQLLLFRLRNRFKCEAREELVDRTIEPRLNQIFVPLLSIIEDGKTREDLQGLARRYHEELVADRGQGVEGQVLSIIRELVTTQPLRPSVKDIATWFADRHGEEYDRKVTAQWVGSIIRNKLHLKTQRGTGGVFVVPLLEEPKLRRLYERYGLDHKGEGSSPCPAKTEPENPHV